MSYTIQWSSQLNGDTNPSAGSIGKNTITIADQTSNTSSTSLTLTGKGLVNYGQYQQENFIRLMENFASQIAPTNPTIGQQWYDTTANTMNVYVGSSVIPGVIISNGWAPMFPTSGVSSSVGAPSSPTIGQIWYDTTNQSLNVYTNAVLPGAPVNAPGWSQFFPSADVLSSATPPTNPALGQMWYNTTNNFLYFWSAGADLPSFFGGWTQLYPTAISSVANVSDYANGSLTGLVNQLNKIVGAPQGTSPQFAFGWGQTDLAAVYTNAGVIQTTADASGWPGSTIATAGLAALTPPQVFQSTFSNTAWTELLARLRKALRQIGQAGPGTMEGQVSPVGFVNDGTPTGANLTYMNFLNAGSAFPPYSAGFNGASNGALLSYFTQTQAAINFLSQNRFALPSPSNVTSTELVSHTTTTTVSATSPTPGTQKVHTITVTFANEAAAAAYFNTGGNLSFNWSFSPTSPDTLNADWASFLNVFSGIRFDYQGVFTPYAPPDGHVAYLPIQAGGTTTKQNGFYAVLAGTLVNGEIFERDVQDTLNYSPYSTDPPSHGGLRILASSTAGAQFVLTFTIQFDFVGASDTIQSGISSSVWATYSNLQNAPAIATPVGAQSGSFITT